MHAAPLGDPRRNRRAAKILSRWVEHPESSIPSAEADRSQTNLTYRFLSTEAVSAQALLEGHAAATRERIAGCEEVYVVQDTTSLDYTALESTRGLGPLENAYRQGLFLHSALVVNPEGTPQGLLAQQYWARRAEETGKRSTRRQKPVGEKESAKWLTGLEACASIPAAVRVLLIGDAESDVYALFAHARPVHVDLLVRAAQDRRLQGEETRLWETVERAPLRGCLEIELGRTRERAPRTARLEVRFCSVVLEVPLHAPQRKHKAPVPLWAVQVREVEAPEGEEAVEWLLLSTREVSTYAQALRRVEAYTQRWKVERFHYVLKSGCKVEALQLESRQRLERALVLYSIVAWRLLCLTYLARETPQAPCTRVLREIEWKVLYRRTQPKKPLPPEPPTLQEAVLWLGRLGGYMGSNQKAPGVKTLWRGVRRLQDLTDGALLLPSELLMNA